MFPDKIHSLLLPIALMAGSLPAPRAQAEALSRGEAVRLAVERNPAAQAALHAWEAARARARLAGALPDPELEIELEEVPALNRPGDHGERAIGVGQRVEFPLKWWHRRQAGRRQAEAVRLSILETARLDLTLRARTTYDRVALRETLLRHARRDRELAGEILRQARVRFEAGDVPELDVIQAGVEAGRADSRLTAAANDLAAARQGLNALLARPLETPFALSDSLVCAPFEADPGDLRETALRQRPELSGLAMSLEALRSRQAEAAAAWWPDLVVGVARQSLHEGDHREESWRLGASVEVPLWAFSRSAPSAPRPGPKRPLAEAEREALRYRVLLETGEACLDLEAAAGQVASSTGRILRGPNGPWPLPSAATEEGRSTYLELIEARRAWNETRRGRTPGSASSTAPRKPPWSAPSAVPCPGPGPANRPRALVPAEE